MKPNFLKRMRQFSLFVSFLLGFSLVPLVAQATMASTNFNGTVSGNPPQVDATTFINTGVWNINTSLLPYQTSHTLNYTNTGGGSMTGSIGWEFDNGPLSNGGRGWSANFYNDNNSTISALDGVSYGGLVSYLLVSATNIVNKGTLSAGANGEIILNGSAVNLSRSGLEITPTVVLHNEFWSAGTNTHTFPSSLWDGTNISAQTFPAFTACGNSFLTIGPLSKPVVADSYSTNLNPFQLTLTNSTGGTTNIIVYSNTVHQAVFVFTTDTNIVATNHFSNSPNPTNFFKIVAVRLSAVSTNQVTLTPQTATLYVVDDLAATTNRTLITNTVVDLSQACTGPTTIPNSLIVSPNDPGAFANGFPGMGRPTNTFFYESSQSGQSPFEISEMSSNSTAIGVADAYSALIDNLAAEPTFGFSITNAPGKIHINAATLDLSRTRMRAESQIMIQASNLIGSVGAVMDAQNLSYNLGATNGFLNVTNLASLTIKRFNGTVTEWSGLWTNFTVTVYSNNMQVVTATSTNYPSSPYTNTTEDDYSVTVVDATRLSSFAQVTVQDLILRSTNIVVGDSMNVTNKLLLNGQSFTLFGDLTFSTGVQNWGTAIAPTLRYFTNYGQLFIPNSAHFGDDGPTNYAAFVNHGSIFSGGQTINSDYLEINNGENIAETADFVATCKTGLITSSVIIGGDVEFFANNLLIDPSLLEAFGSLDFTVTNSLSDAGFPTGNIFFCENGFNLFVKPTTGDLLGTTVTNAALEDDEVDNVWAGHDFGTNTLGYTNNAAIGNLVLLQANNLFEPLWHFIGASANNGLYVSNLDLSTLTDYADEIDIDANLKIYYASAEVNGLGHPAAEQFLDGQQFPSGGSLHWVQGVTSLVKQPIISGGMMSGGKYKLNLITASGQTNVIEASTNFVNWVSIYTNIGSSSSSFIDSKATNYPYRFYRVKTMP